MKRRRPRIAQQTIRSVERAAQILETIAEARRPTTLGEVVERVGLPPGTVHRVLATLLTLGWVDQDTATGSYQLGVRSLGVGGVALAYAPLVRRAEPVLAQVSAFSGLHSFLAVLLRDRVVYLAHSPGRAERKRDFRPGASQPVHCTSAGKLLLAHDRAAEQRFLSGTRPLRRYTDRTCVDRDQLASEFERVRADGYALDRGEYAQGWQGIAIPVRRRNDAVAAALTCGGYSEGEPLLAETVRPEMLLLASELSHELGFEA